MMTGGQRDIMADVSVLKSWQSGILVYSTTTTAVALWREGYVTGHQLVETDGQISLKHAFRPSEGFKNMALHCWGLEKMHAVLVYIRFWRQTYRHRRR